MKPRYISVRIILLLFVFIFLLQAHSRAQVIQWAKSGGGTDNEYSSAIAADANGNIYTIGTFSGTAVFGGYTLATVVSKGDIFITKADAATGNVIWARKLGSQAEDYAGSIATGPNGEVYCTGRFSGTITLGAGTYTAAGSYDAFVAKIDPATGNVAWAQKLGGTGYDHCSGVAADAAGNIYTTGNFQGTAAFGTYSLTPVGSNFNVFAAKLDGATGSVLWATGMGGTGYNFGNGIACDASGHVYTTGSMEGTAIFGSYTLTSKGNSDIFIAKTDAATGTVLWARNFGGTGNDSGSGITGNGGGYIYTTGKFESQVIFGSDTLVSHGSADGFTIKQDAGNSNVLWASRAGGTGYDASNALSFDALGNIYTTGQFSGVIILDNLTFYGQGAADAYMARISDATGRMNWAMQAGGAGADIGSGIARDATGSIYVTGSFQLNSVFENTPLTAAGGSDVFTLKLNSAIVGLNKNILLQNDLKIYPNPFDDELHLSLNDNDQSQYNITVTDVAGRILTQLAEQRAGIDLNMAALSAGVYYITVNKGSGNNISRKVVKK